MAPQSFIFFQLTILNAGYLAKAKDLSQVLIPLVINVLLVGLKLKGLNDSEILFQMGLTDNQLKLPYPLNPAFGSWINLSPYFAFLRKNYSVVEMNGFYGAFLNASKYGPSTDTPLLKKCLNGSLFSVQCGLSAFNLKLLSKEPRAAIFIQQLLCPDRKSACFNASNTLTYQALGAFITELSKDVLFFWRKTTLGRQPLDNQSEWLDNWVCTMVTRRPNRNTYPSDSNLTCQWNWSHEGGNKLYIPHLRIHGRQICFYR